MRLILRRFGPTALFPLDFSRVMESPPIRRLLLRIFDAIRRKRCKPLLVLRLIEQLVDGGGEKLGAGGVGLGQPGFQGVAEGE